MLSPHFALEEAACHSGAALPPERYEAARRLALGTLEPLRERWGAPIVVVSWYRTPLYNARVGGALNSQHPLGTAVDCRPAELAALPRFKQVIDDMIHEMRLPDLGGYGWYPGRWVHLDCRNKLAGGHVARWEGTGTGSER